jgi:hypothetical protein
MISLALLLSSPLTAFSQTSSIPPANQGTNAVKSNTTNLLEPAKLVKNENLAKKELLDLSVQLMFASHGQQTFDVIDSDESLISRLKFPQRGQAMIFKGELHILPRLSVGGRFSNSRILQMKDSTSTDTDWKDATGGLVWTESTDTCKTEVTFFDANIYGRLLNLEKGKYEDFTDKLSDFLLAGKDSRMTVDIFGGYQYQKGSYGLYDATDTVDNYIPVSEKSLGHDSFYKVFYRGPRLGARGEYSYKKLATRLSFAYAWLKTNSHGWWNMRDYPWQQGDSGYSGYGVDLEAEFEYQFTKHISGGFGYNYMIRRQHKSKESGHEAGKEAYSNADIIRNVNNTLSGPTVFVKVAW